ncbi:MAG: 3-deoxy-D-manno-octulosonic acid transferase [Desulforhopalus sp.]|nr:3-deoxy-D-manno-octulosonic acid transferase [Desulforhopalus sp.]
MFLLYNIVQFAFLLVFSPLLILFVLCSNKYRDRVPARLGAGLGKKLTRGQGGGRTIWVHALSVGEVTSAVPLIRGLRATYPDHRIVVTATTRTGKQVADNLLGQLADYILDSPLDLLPVVHLFIRHIRPDLFILVETDFWPNILACLHDRGTPCILVNGRMSAKSMARYQRLHFFFAPMFRCFAFLGMQTQRDREKMQQLGLAPEKLPILGNLKYATRPEEKPGAMPGEHRHLMPDNRILFLAGSTHLGEEEILIRCYVRLRATYPKLFLIIAPRDPNRAVEIAGLAANHGLQVSLRSTDHFRPSDMFILDSIGELIEFYALADLAFVGGSLVAKGGHNPVEPASMAIPVLFGPYMEDFCEIAASLIQTGGAREIRDEKNLQKCLGEILADQELRIRMGRAAQDCIVSNHDIIDKHIELIKKIL